MRLSKIYTKMGSAMVVGILLLLSLPIIPSSAQQAGSCWTKIADCMESAKAQSYPPALVLLCCPSISAAITNQLSCFCLGKSDIISQDGSYLFDSFLKTCSITGTLDTICPDASSSTPSVTPSTPSATPSTPSTTPSTPSATPSTASGTPSTPTTSTSSNDATPKIATKSITGVFMILMSLMIC